MANGIDSVSRRRGQANRVIRSIEQAGYEVYFTHRSGIVICVAPHRDEPRIVVGSDENGDPLRAAIAAADKLGLRVPADSGT